MTLNPIFPAVNERKNLAWPRGFGLVIISLILMMSACSKAVQKQSAASSNEPPAATKEAILPTIDPALAAQGKLLYNQNCIFCHQADAIGKPGVAPSLINKEFLAIASDAFLVGTVTDGRPGTGMPPFAHLGEKNILAVVAYLQSHAELPSRAEQVQSQDRSQGDPRMGKQWFDHICAGCHGPNGNGYAAGGTGTAIGKAGFLRKVSDGFIRATIKIGRSNTRMRSFHGPDGLANLSNQEIDDIIAYLRTTPSS